MYDNIYETSIFIKFNRDVFSCAQDFTSVREDILTSLSVFFLSVLGVACGSRRSFVALIENSVKWRWVPPHHFPHAVGGRVYFPLSAVYVNEKKTGLQADR